MPTKARTTIEKAMAPDLTFLKNEFGVELTPEGTPKFQDVDYAAALTPELKMQATEFIESLRKKRTQSTKS